MIWGYANGWFPAFRGGNDDSVFTRLDFLEKWTFFREVPVPLGWLVNLDSSERARLQERIDRSGFILTPSVGFDYADASASEAERQAGEILRSLESCRSLARSPAVFTSARCEHRFADDLPLEEKLDRLAGGMRPLAQGVHDLGLRLGINNQGDFYIDDFLALCERTPHLWLFIDTSNIFWAGEPIFPAFERAAPKTIGTHWRDEKCVPGNKKPRGFLLENCVTGTGHVDLERCFRVLREKAPFPDELVMELELFPGRGIDHEEALQQAIDYLARFRTES